MIFQGGGAPGTHLDGRLPHLPMLRWRGGILQQLPKGGSCLAGGGPVGSDAKMRGLSASEGDSQEEEGAGIGEI